MNRVTFEFDLTGQGVAPGNRRVLINNAVTSADVAAAMRTAINAVSAPGANQQDALVTVADTPLATFELFAEFHSSFVILHRIANFDTDPLLSGILEDTTDIGAAPGTVNAGSAPEEEFGDKNIHRDQGQLIIHGNSITNAFNYGILVDAPPRDPGTNLPHPGAVRNLQDFNSLRLAPGVTITNNLIANNFAGGIFFSGDTGADPLAAVPFGRIINNTIFGGLLASGIGIQVTDNAAPTLLNNVVANMLTGISVDGTLGARSSAAQPITATRPIPLESASARSPC